MVTSLTARGGLSSSNENDAITVTSAPIVQGSDLVHDAVPGDPITATIKNLHVNGFISPTTGVANFLNVPYARIPTRFREAVLVDPEQETGTIEATAFGPVCPQPLDIVHQLSAYLYPKVYGIDNADEFSCLNLNIYDPPDAVISGQSLPVIVWIHGGGLVYGANSDEYGENVIRAGSDHLNHSRVARVTQKVLTDLWR